MRIRTVVVIALTAALLASCGGGDDDASETDAGANDDAAELAIESPADGAQVSLPFTVEVSSSEDIGGDHHFHIYYDGNADDYEVVESESVEVTDLAPGEHTITVSLRTADHAAAGVEDEITVTVVGTGGGGDTTEDDGKGDY